MIHSSIPRRHLTEAPAAGVSDPQLAASQTSNQPWIDSGAWRLPSGKALSEFALQAGFLAPHLFAVDGRSSLIGSKGIGSKVAASAAAPRESGKRAG